MKKSPCFFLLLVFCAFLILNGCANPSTGAPPVTVDESKFLTGSGIPSDSVGADGDLYLDTANLVLYVKTSGAWANVGVLRGPAGTGWIVGAGAPGSSLGSLGDLYLDTNTLDCYEKQDATTWSLVVSLAGAGHWFVGQGEPTGQGNLNAGDLYLDLLSTLVYTWSGSAWSPLIAFQVAIPQYIFTPNFINSMQGTAFGQGKCVAVGYAGTIVYTSDGSNWDYAYIDGGNSGGGLSVMPIGGHRPTSATTAWQAPSAQQTAMHQSALSRKHAFNRTSIYQSITSDASNPNDYYDLVGVAYDEVGTFVAVGTDYRNGDVVMLVSTDAIDWTSSVLRPAGNNYSVYGVTFAKGKFVIYGRWSPEGTVSFAIVGIPAGAWSEYDLSGGGFYGGASDGTTFVIGGNASIQSTADLQNWNEVTPNDSVYVYDFITISGMAYGAGKFVAVGRGDSTATILASGPTLSTASWTQQDLPLGSSVGLSSVAFGRFSGFVAVGDRGTLLTSSTGLSWDLKNWDVYDGGNYFNFAGVAFGSINGQALYAIAQYQPVF